MEILVNRDVHTDDSSLGQMFLNDTFECYTLEDKEREISGLPVGEWKVDGNTAIPFGRYRVVLQLSKRFEMVTPHVIGVPGFTAIEIHPGNTHLDTEGCILVGTQRGADSLDNSRIAFINLMSKLKLLTEDIYLTVA